MSSAPRYIPHCTVEDYLHWEGEWQLIDGVAIAMSPSPFGHHERILSRLATKIGTQIQAQGCPCEVYLNLDWITNDDTVVRPDLMVVCGDQPDGHLERSPVLAVEVLSESTRAHDPSVKKGLYLENGGRNYLIVDPDARTVESFCPDGQPQTSELSSISISLDSSGSCEIEIVFEDLFDRKQ